MNPQYYYARAAQEPETITTKEPFSCLQQAMRTLAASMGSQFKGILPMLYAQLLHVGRIGSYSNTNNNSKNSNNNMTDDTDRAGTGTAASHL